MKEIFIIKDCFEVHNEVSDFFSKKRKEIKLIDSDEISEIKSSQSTLIIDKKFENKQGGQSNILKIARNIGSTKLIVLDSGNNDSYDLKKEMGGAYIKISYKLMDEVIKEIIFPDHYDYQKDDIDKIRSEAEKLNASIVTTEKDFVKINKIDKINTYKDNIDNI